MPDKFAVSVKDDLDRFVFPVFTSFPTNVDVSVIDRVDVDFHVYYGRQ